MSGTGARAMAAILDFIRAWQGERPPDRVVPEETTITREPSQTFEDGGSEEDIFEQRESPEERARRLQGRADRAQASRRASRAEEMERARWRQHRGRLTPGERSAAGLSRGRGRFSTPVRPRPSITSSGGGGLLASLLNLLSIVTLVAETVTAQNPREAVTALATGLGAMAAARILGGAATVLFLSGDSGPAWEQEVAQRQWQTHVDEVIIPELATILRQYELALRDLQDFIEDYRISGSVWSAEYLNSRISEVGTRIYRIREQLRSNLRQLSRQDLPHVRQELERNGVSTELTQQLR